MTNEGHRFEARFLNLKFFGFLKALPESEIQILFRIAY